MTPPPTDVAALVLAGGQAMRMGGEKALRPLRGRTLLEHAIATCAAAVSEVIVACGQRALDVPPGARCAPDSPEFAGRGPLAGILAGLNATTRPKLIVLACDLPNIPATLLRLLADSLDGHDVALCEHDGQTEPLVAALRVDVMRKVVAAALAAGRLKVDPLWRSRKCRVLHDAELAAFAPLARTFANVNTLDELERLERE